VSVAEERHQTRSFHDSRDRHRNNNDAGRDQRNPRAFPSCRGIGAECLKLSEAGRTARDMAQARIANLDRLAIRRHLPEKVTAGTSDSLRIREVVQRGLLEQVQ
jgi:hypothetical protein